MIEKRNTRRSPRRATFFRLGDDLVVARRCGVDIGHSDAARDKCCAHEDLLLGITLF